MQDTTGLCRNCHSKDTIKLNQGLLAPFFVKKVYDIYLPSLEEFLKSIISKTTKIKRKFLGTVILNLLRGSKLGKTLLRFRGNPTVDIRVCKSCEFIGPEFNYTHEILNNLYTDYRSESYNRERTLFEVNYKKGQKYIGKSAVEVTNRLTYIDTLISKYVDVSKIINVIDWGGGEGRFVPSQLKSKKVWILDVSNEPLVDTKFKRVKTPPDHIEFDYVQICHLLEHINSPFEFMTEVLKHIRTNGYVYIELPQDWSDENIQKLLNCDTNIYHSIHEHLNLFSTRSLKNLALALDLQILNIEAKNIDFGWTKVNILSGLFSKK